MLSPEKKKKQSAIKGSFLSGSFIGDEPANAPETEEQRIERENKEFMNSFKIMNKEETKEELKKKDFDAFLSYSKCSEFRYDEPDGLVNIFSLNLKNRPEITLTC